MDNVSIYQDIAKRTGGEVYIGVVGAVRTGKSMFISKFIEQLVLPNVSSESERARIIDEMPQSGSGVTVTTAEPKFCPSGGAVLDTLGIKAKIRLCDCAGFLVEGAEKIGGDKRKITTMWSETPLGFADISEIGTTKMIEEHSTVAVLVASDGSIVDIPRENYQSGEERAVEKLKKAGKPFIVLLNSLAPTSEKTQKLASELAKKYNARVIAKNVAQLNELEVSEILQELSKEFKIKKFEMKMPKWMQLCGRDNEVVKSIFSKLSAVDMDKIATAEEVCDYLSGGDIILKDVAKDLGTGVVTGEFEAREGLFFEVLSQKCGVEISDEFSLISQVKELQEAKEEYEKLKNALYEAEATGYGVVLPSVSQLELFEPELLKEGGQFGVKLKAKAPSLHIMKVDVETELRPIVGSEAQGEELVNSMLKDFENSRGDIWETNMFGRPLSGLICDGINQKLAQMPQEVRTKMRKTVSRIVNEGKGGVICIIL
ncbi:MAG: stage IV sporulation protein A [Bacillota bacterium]